MGEQGGHSKLTDSLDECFPNANTVSTQERRKAVGITPLAIRSQKVRTVSVKALWNETLRFDPLSWIVAQTFHSDRDNIAFSDLEFLTLDSLSHADGRGIVYWRHHTHGLIETVRISEHVSIVLVIDQR